MPEENVGPLDAYLRVTAGLMLLGWGASRRHTKLVSGLLMAVGAMRVAEGVTRWCPVLELLGKNTLNWGRSARHPFAHQLKGYSEGDFLREDSPARRDRGPLRWAGRADGASDERPAAAAGETAQTDDERPVAGRARIRRGRSGP
ncbi:MAG TPA: DUF2892 domain-containing protein [Limnochordia bacterium]